MLHHQHHRNEPGDHPCEPASVPDVFRSDRGVGPRYCPSIEDKFVRFAQKESHQIFLEPEGIATDEIYVNGFSTCLPFEIQVEMVRSIVGCERAGDHASGVRGGV